MYQVQRISGNFIDIMIFQKQQDAHDLLMSLFEQLEEEATKKKKESLVQMVFGGKICSSGTLLEITFMIIVQCLTCYKVSRSFDPFNNLTLNISFSSKSREYILD